MLHITKDTTNINGEIFDTKYVEIVFPGSTYIPDLYEGRKYDTNKYNYFYGKNLSNSNMAPSWEIGDKIISNIKSIKSVQNHFKQEEKEKDYLTLRKAEYPSTDDMIVAMWEHIVEGKKEKICDLQEIRLQIKNKYPKPDIGE